jgi:hypothetical protein
MKRKRHTEEQIIRRVDDNAFSQGRQVGLLSWRLIVAHRAKPHDEPGELIGCIIGNAEIQRARNYWFSCPGCKYDWATWLRPSITFVSLFFVTDECPNCHQKHVRASGVKDE